MANEPITREEILLNAIATGEQTDIKPITREEMFLAKLGGADVNIPTPITRKEQFLLKAIENGGNTGGGGSSGGDEWFNDGNTHIWISLPEHRTSPMLGVCPNGTVTVDWGDGTEPDTLTGNSTSTVKWTRTHNYAEPGDYVITLIVDGEIKFYGSPYIGQGSGILRHSSEAAQLNKVYQTAVRKVEMGDGVTSIGDSAFYICHSLTSVVIPEGVTSIGDDAFHNCHSLTSAVIPGSVTSIGGSAFHNCHSLTSVVIPEGVTSIGGSAFYNCHSLTSVVIPEGVTSIDTTTFYSCYSLTSVVIPESVTSIGGNAFGYDSGVRYYDFTACTSVPTLIKTDAFSSKSADCQMLVPAALYDEWIAATNWATYASNIVAV